MAEQGPLPVLQMIKRNTLTLGGIEKHSSISYDNYKSYQSHKPQANKLLGLIFDSKSYLSHRKNILATQSVVDDKPPRIHLEDTINFKKYPAKINEQMRLNESNKELVQSLNKINRSKANVDCWNTAGPETSKNRYPRMVLNNAIMKDNIHFYGKLREAKSIYQRSEMIEDYKRKENQRRAMCKYPPYWETQFGSGIERQLSITGLDTYLTRTKGSKYYMSHRRPRCFLEFTANKYYLGTVVVELYYDYVPVTAENFIYLCYNINSSKIPMKQKVQVKKPNENSKDEKIMNYKGCLVHRIVPGYYIQTGDIVSKSGTGGYSIYGPVFPDENFKLKHNQRGVLSMANKGPNTNNSQFIITFKKLETLDGTQVVFGRVVQGFKTLEKIEELGTRSGCPRTQVKISQCGIIGFKRFFKMK